MLNSKHGNLYFELKLVQSFFLSSKITKDRYQVRYFSSKSGENSFFDDFRRYPEIRKYLEEKHKQNSGLTSLSHIGKSVEGRPIMCLKIGEKIGSPGKPIIYIDGGMHAREWAAVSTALYIIDHLLSDYASGDPNVRFLFKKYDFYV